MTHLARESGRQQNTPDIAHATGVPQPMTSKILKMLARAELLASHRGAHGGYGLARNASRITVAEVIEALDGPIAMTECLEPGPGDCGLEPLCITRSNWQRINGAIRHALTGITIDEMARTVPDAFLAPEERLARNAGALAPTLQGIG